MDSPTACRMVELLVRRGLVRVDADPTDRRRRAVSLVVVAGLLGAACGGRTRAPRQAAAPVVAETAVRRAVPLELHAVGNAETIDTVAVRPLVGGELVDVRFREGTDVKAGAVLFVIDPRPYGYCTIRSPES